MSSWWFSSITFSKTLIYCVCIPFLVTVGVNVVYLFILYRGNDRSIVCIVWCQISLLHEQQRQPRDTKLFPNVIYFKNYTFKRNFSLYRFVFSASLLTIMQDVHHELQAVSPQLWVIHRQDSRNLQDSGLVFGFSEDVGALIRET